jgi:predicted dehydrogenase
VSDGKRIKVGIVGAGRIAHVHAKYYATVPFVDVVGVADVVPGKAAEAASAWGVPAENAFLDYRNLLDKVEMDAVSICTFNQAHREPTVDALAAGKHVLLEKPMAATLEDAQAIMRAWEAAEDRILMVGFQPDFSSEHLAAFEVVRSGALGDVYYGEAVTCRRWGIPGGTFMKEATAGAGTIVDTGVYAIHTMLTLMGNPKPVSVSAMTTNRLGKAYQGTGRGWGGSWKAEDLEVEEFAVAFVRFENGAVMVLKSSWAANTDSMGVPFVLGTKGGLSLSPLTIYLNQGIGDLNLTATPQGLPPQSFDSMWTGKMTAFAEAVRDGKPSPIDTKAVFLVNVVMDGVLRSAKLGYEVKVDSTY